MNFMLASVLGVGKQPLIGHIQTLTMTNTFSLLMSKKHGIIDPFCYI